MSDALFSDLKVITKTTILAGSGQKSLIVRTAGTTLCSIFIPSGFLGTTISFEVSDTVDGTFAPLVVSSTPTTPVILTVTLLAQRPHWHNFSPADFHGVKYLKIISNADQISDQELKILSTPMS